MIVLAFALFALLIVAWLVAPSGETKTVAKAQEPKPVAAPQLTTSEAAA